MDKIEVNNDLFRKRFEKISQEKNYSKVAIAAALGSSKQALGNMLHKDKFNEDFLTRLALTLSCSVDYLTGKTDDPDVFLFPYPYAEEDTNDEFLQKHPEIIKTPEGLKIAKRNMISTYVTTPTVVSAKHYSEYHPDKMEVIIKFLESASEEQINQLISIIKTFNVDSNPNFFTAEVASEIYHDILVPVYLETAKMEYQVRAVIEKNSEVGQIKKRETIKITLKKKYLAIMHKKFKEYSNKYIKKKKIP